MKLVGINPNSTGRGQKLTLMTLISNCEESSYVQDFWINTYSWRLFANLLNFIQNIKKWFFGFLVYILTFQVEIWLRLYSAVSVDSDSQKTWEHSSVMRSAGKYSASQRSKSLKFRIEQSAVCDGSSVKSALLCRAMASHSARPISDLIVLYYTSLNQRTRSV